MSYIGHPLPGDFLYNPDYRYISRQPLHSYGLEFIHPLTGEPLSFTAHLPADMAALVKEPELTSTEAFGIMIFNGPGSHLAPAKTYISCTDQYPAFFTGSRHTGITGQCLPL